MGHAGLLIRIERSSSRSSVDRYTGVIEKSTNKVVPDSCIFELFYLDCGLLLL